MKSKIFSFTKVSQDSMIASVKITLFLSKELGLPICVDDTIADEPLDALIIVNGAYAFAGSGLLEALGKALEQANRVIWVQNDYTIIPPKPISNAESPFRAAFRFRHERGMNAPDYWTTVRDMSSPGWTKTKHLAGGLSRYINWNCLAFDEDRDVRSMETREFGGRMIYYGSFRKDRERDFTKYFSDPDVPIVISSPTMKFSEAYKSGLVTHIGKSEDIYTLLGEFGMGLYLEDRLSHTSYHSPANRFYEMLSVGLPIAFDAACMKTMAMGGYECSDYVIWDKNDLAAIMEKRAEICSSQILDWAEKAIQEKVITRQVLHDQWKEVEKVV